MTSVTSEICLDEKKLREKFEKEIKVFHETMSDLPVNPCVSCERLFSNKNMRKLEDLEKLKDNCNLITELLGMELEKKFNHVQQLFDYLEKEGIEGTKVCNGCFLSFKNYKMPSMCVLNNLFTT